MVEHAAGLDDIELSAERAQLQQVGLGVLNRRHIQFARLPYSVGEAASAQVDGQYPSLGELLRCSDRLLAGAATCHQDFRPAAWRRMVGSHQREGLTQI